MTGRDEPDPRLVRYRKLPRPVRLIYARPRIFVSALFGLAACLLLPAAWRPMTRALVSWDAAIALYVALAFIMMSRSGTAHIRRDAIMQDDGRFLILMVTALGAFASIAAIVSELGAPHHGAFELVLATVTIALSWAAVHTTFALHYAHDYYRGAKPGGLAFPGADNDSADSEPDYWDFVYFSFVIGMTAQVSDVGITTKAIRHTATAHGVVSFIFNTALLALMVNIAASAI